MKTKKEEINIVGKGKKGIFIIGETNSSRSIQRELFLKNVDLLEDCYCISVPKLRGNKKKEFKEELDKKLIELAVHHIMVFGEPALKFLYSGRVSKLGIATYRGTIIPDRKYSAHVCPLLDPVEVDHAFNQNLPSVFARDLERVLDHLETPAPVYNDPIDNVVVCLDYVPLIARLEKIIDEKPLIVYDYETTSLKPFNPGHKIVSIGVATGVSSAFSFPFQYKHWNEEQYKQIEKLWKKILVDPDILKVAHNAGFEGLWERIILKTERKGLVWDSMLTAHLLDSRANVVGLKIQAFIGFGVEDYNSEAKEYISSEGEFNKMMDMPVTPLCMYNVIDALVTYWLYRKQRREVAVRDLSKANNFFLEASGTFLDTQLNGIRIDTEYFQKIDQELDLKLIEIDAKINSNKVVGSFKEFIGHDLNFNSVKDLRSLFFDMLKIDSIKQTKNGSASVDAETLGKLEHPIAKLIVEQRKLLKLKNTYVGQLTRENNDGYIHPFFHLHRCTSYRSSSSGPNFQNMPNHDLVAKKMIRGGLYPHPGHHLVELDYSAAEVKTAACVTGDAALIGYVLDESTDMHRDQAVNIWICTQDMISKSMRQVAKNELVFPQIYKAWFGTCANMLWTSSQKLKLADGSTVLEYLKNKGITTSIQFKEHIKKVCGVFWKRFPELQMWQDRMIAEYQKKGFLRTVTGFDCSSVLTENMCCNYPIQGPSFHCLLWSMIELNKKLKNHKTKIIGQIHDSLVLSIPPEELSIVLPMAQKIMTDDMKAANPWVKVPFAVDFEIASMNRPWSEKKDGNWDDYKIDKSS